MKKPSMNMIVILLLSFALSLYVFEPFFMSNFWGFIKKSPIVFHDIKIKFPKGIIYAADDNSVTLSPCIDPHAFLYIQKMPPEKLKKEKLIRFFKNKGFHILTSQSLSVKGYEGFTISYVDNDTWEYNKVFCITPKGLFIGYTGTKEDYEPFKKIINDIEFR